MRSQKGFTLIELAIVVAIITLLVVGVSIYATSFKNDTVATGVATYISDWKKALGRYYSIYSNYPTTISSNDFDKNFLKTTPIEGVSLVNYNSNYSGGSCTSEPAVELSFEDVNEKERAKQELGKRNIKICSESGNKLVISVRP